MASFALEVLPRMEKGHSADLRVTLLQDEETQNVLDRFNSQVRVRVRVRVTVRLLQQPG